MMCMLDANGRRMNSKSSGRAGVLLLTFSASPFGRGAAADAPVDGSGPSSKPVCGLEDTPLYPSERSDETIAGRQS